MNNNSIVMTKEALEKLAIEIKNKYKRSEILIELRKKITQKLTNRIFAIDNELECMQKLYWRATGKWVNVNEKDDTSA